MKNALRTLAAASGLLLACAASHAGFVSIGGLNVPVGGSFSVGQIYENVPTNIGDTLAGYGKVDSINSLAVGTLCAGCELTYQFGGYTVTSLSSSEIRFSGGWIKFFLGFGINNDFNTGNAGGSAGDLAEATNGTLFLALKGHAIDAAGNTFIGTGTNIGTPVPTGFGTGLADVDFASAGLANAFFDTNSIVAAFGGPADFEIGSSFSGLHPPYPRECPHGPACLRGSTDLTASVVPEPGSTALVLTALGALALSARRRKH
jgi:hypothetical protein